MLKRIKHSLASWGGHADLRSSILLEFHQLHFSLKGRIGRLEERLLSLTNVSDFKKAEFQVYSQWGEDGIIQYLLRHVTVDQNRFVEFGVENYTEANTRWLLDAHNWSGLVIDGNEHNISQIQNDQSYWKHRLKAICAFVDRDNINGILERNGFAGEIGILSIDIDGVDFWVWESISVVSAAIVIVEYNSLFGPHRAVTVPYDPAFRRVEKHYSTSYYGASLKALVRLGVRKGYAFVGSNSAGNNAFFVKNSLLKKPLYEITAEEGYVRRTFREARNESGNLLFPTFEEESALISHLPLVEID